MMASGHPGRGGMVIQANGNVTVEQHYTNTTVLTSADVDHMLSQVRDQLQPLVTKLVSRITALEADRDQLVAGMEALIVERAEMLALLERQAAAITVVRPPVASLAPPPPPPPARGAEPWMQ